MSIGAEKHRNMAAVSGIATAFGLIAFILSLIAESHVVIKLFNISVVITGAYFAANETAFYHSKKKKITSE